MTVVFSHETALERLRSIPPQIAVDSVTSSPLPGQFVTTNYKEALALDPCAYGIRTEPLHVLVKKGTEKSRSPRVRSHEFAVGEYPAGAIGILGGSVHSSSPELTFIELARSWGLLESVCLGFELCGAYSHFAAPISGFYDRPPLTTPERIEAVLDGMPGLYGASRVRAALERVCPGARSPMETVTACELGFPVEKGGFGLEKPQLNYRVDLDEAGRRLARASCCYIDMAWPEARVGIEYNGRDFHLDSARDRKRIEALEHMGWFIVTVEASDLGKPSKVADVVDVVGPRVSHGAEEGGVTRPDFYMRQGLHRDLLAATRCGLGMESVLFGVPVPRGSVSYHL